MYTITATRKVNNETEEVVIYDSSDIDNYLISEPTLNLTLGEAGSCEFTVIPGHPQYNILTKMRTFIKVFRDEEEIFFGRILSSDKDMNGLMKVYCEGAYTFFLDTEMEKAKHNETISAFFARCIQVHNDQLYDEDEKKFTVGEVTIEKASEKMDFKIEDYSQTKNAIDSLLVGKHGGYIRIRPNPNGPHFIDYVATYGEVNTQIIKIAENIINKDDHISGENIFTILRPLGAKNIDISGVPQSSITLPNVTKVGNTLELDDMITQYGRIIRTERFQEIDKKETLLAAAEDFIKRRGSQLPSTSEIGFVDFHLLNPEVMKVSLGDTFTNIEGFSGQTMTVGELNLDLANPANDKMTLKNEEEINANDPSSSSGSLSSSYASKCTHIDYIYKYIHEGENSLSIITDDVTVAASNILTLGGQFSYLVGGHLFLIAEKNDGTGEITLTVAKNLSTNPYDRSDIVMSLNNVAIKNANLEVEGYVKAQELQADIAYLGFLNTENLNAAIGSIGHITSAGFYYLEGDEIQGDVINGISVSGQSLSSTGRIDGEWLYVDGLTVGGSSFESGQIAYYSTLNLTPVSVMGANGVPMSILTFDGTPTLSYATVLKASSGGA